LNSQKTRGHIKLLFEDLGGKEYQMTIPVLVEHSPPFCIFPGEIVVPQSNEAISHQTTVVLESLVGKPQSVTLADGSWPCSISRIDQLSDNTARLTLVLHGPFFPDSVPRMQLLCSIGGASCYELPVPITIVPNNLGKGKSPP